MQRLRPVMTAAGTVLLAGGVFVGTRPMPRDESTGSACGRYFWPRCDTYEWPSVVAVTLSSGGVALLAAMAVCWLTGRRARAHAPLDSIAPAEGMSTVNALLFIALPIFVAAMVAGAFYFNLVVQEPLDLS